MIVHVQDSHEGSMLAYILEMAMLESPGLRYLMKKNKSSEYCLRHVCNTGKDLKSHFFVSGC